MFEGSKARQRDVAYVTTTVDSGVILLSGSGTGKVKKKSQRNGEQRGIDELAGSRDTNQHYRPHDAW